MVLFMRAAHPYRELGEVGKGQSKQGHPHIPFSSVLYWLAQHGQRMPLVAYAKGC